MNQIKYRCVGIKYWHTFCEHQGIDIYYWFLEELIYFFNTQPNVYEFVR